VLTAAVLNALRKKGTRQIRPGDLTPELAPRPQGPKEMLDRVRLINAAMRGRDLTKRRKR